MQPPGAVVICGETSNFPRCSEPGVLRYSRLLSVSSYCCYCLCWQYLALLAEKYPAEWIFWPSGTCEPAIVRFQGPAGSWTANYSPLTARPEITNYAVR